MDLSHSIMALLAGLALFLYGMELMADSLKLVAGDRMHRLLGTLTTNRFAGVGTGAFVTAIIQSSSVTTVLVIGFITAGLMNLQQSIGIILGANIGTTITAQIIAFKITKYALVMIAVGFAFLFLSKREVPKHYGGLLFGLGLVFFGMQMMSDATRPLREIETIRVWMQAIGPFGGVALGAVFTALVQSSSATTGIVIVLASQGLVGLEAGIALVLGANIGTCATALLAAIGKPRVAVQAALVHVLFKVLGVLLWFGFIGLLGSMVRELSSDPARQIAHAHTIFNVINTLLLLPFVVPFARLVQRLVPERAPMADAPLRPRHLDDILLASPDAALAGLRAELGHLGSHTAALLAQVPETITAGDQAALRALEARDEDIDTLERACVAFGRSLALGELSTRQATQLNHLLDQVTVLEQIADVVCTDLVAAGRSRLERGLVISATTAAQISHLHDQVQTALTDVLKSIVEGDAALAAEVRKRKADVRSIHEALERHLTERLLTDDPKRVHIYSLERDLVDNLYRLFALIRRLAKGV